MSAEREPGGHPPGPRSEERGLQDELRGRTRFTFKLTHIQAERIRNLVNAVGGAPWNANYQSAVRCAIDFLIRSMEVRWNQGSPFPVRKTSRYTQGEINEIAKLYDDDNFLLERFLKALHVRPNVQRDSVAREASKLEEAGMVEAGERDRKADPFQTTKEKREAFDKKLAKERERKKLYMREYRKKQREQKKRLRTDPKKTKPTNPKKKKKKRYYPKGFM